jgi:hypothetical protein
VEISRTQGGITISQYQVTLKAMAREARATAELERISIDWIHP